MSNSTQPSLFRRKPINPKYCFFLLLWVSQVFQVQAQSSWGTNHSHNYSKKEHNYDICFPADVTSNSCVAPTNIPGVKLDELGYDKLAVNVSDKVYRTGSEACYKIFRTYTVINWALYNESCQFDPMSNPVIIDRDAPDFDNINGEGVYVLVRTNTAYLSHDKVVSADDQKMDLTPVCLENGGFHFRGFMYTQIIKVQETERPVVAVPTLPIFKTNMVTCKSAIDVTFSATDNCSKSVSLETQSIMIAPFQSYTSGEMRMPANYDSRWTWKDNKDGSFNIKIANLPEGKHDLIVVVRDQCGNLSVPTRIPFEVKDCTAPSPICRQGLATALMSDGNGGAMNTVWASDYVASPVYDCNGQGPETDKNGLKKITRYSINRVGETPHIDSTSITFTCAEAGLTVDVELHAWDQLGNHGYCVTYMLVQDNQKRCPAAPGIMGIVANAKGRRLGDVVLTAKQEIAAYQTKTNKGGFYHFTELAEHERYIVRPALKSADAQGVTGTDLNLLLNVVKNNQLSKLTPHQLLAADVDQNGTLDMQDYNKLREIYYKRDSFPGNNCWRFIDAKFPLSKSLQPGFYPDSIVVDSLYNGIAADFIAIKLGDLDNSYVPSNTSLQAGPQLAGFSSVDLKNDQKLNTELKLEQNQPNPFHHETLIPFYLPTAGLMNLSVWDLQGQLIYTYSNDMPAGEHQISLSEQNLKNAKGVFYYTLQTAQGRETKKMLRF